jgi:hypothetical protein
MRLRQTDPRRHVIFTAPPGDRGEAATRAHVDQARPARVEHYGLSARRKIRQRDVRPTVSAVRTSIQPFKGTCIDRAGPEWVEGENGDNVRKSQRSPGCAAIGALEDASSAGVHRQCIVRINEELAKWKICELLPSLGGVSAAIDALITQRIDSVRVFRIDDQLIEGILHDRPLTHLPSAPAVSRDLHTATGEAALKGIHEGNTASASSACDDQIAVRPGTKRGDGAVAGRVEYSTLNLPRNRKSRHA